MKHFENSNDKRGKTWQKVAVKHIKFFQEWTRISGPANPIPNGLILVMKAWTLVG